MPEPSKPVAFLAKHSLKILALVSLSAIAVGTGVVFGAGWAAIVTGGLLWLDLAWAGARKAGKP